MADPYFGTCWLTVSKRQHGAYSGNELKFAVSSRRPVMADLPPGSYCLKLRVFVPRKCLERESGYIDVRAVEPGDPSIEVQP